MIDNRTTVATDARTKDGIQVINGLATRPSSGRAIAHINPLGDRTTFAYDALDNRLRTTDPLGNISTTVYDSVNRPIASIDPLGDRLTT